MAVLISPWNKSRSNFMIDALWKMPIITLGILLYFIESASGALPCKETKKLFKDIQKKLDTPLPINYGPAFFFIICFVLIVFIVKTLYDVLEHRKRMNYINKWDEDHLGDQGIRNEVYVPYPETKQRYGQSIHSTSFD